MAAQPTLQNGLIWRIGCGKNIYVWRDKWLSKPTTYKVQSPRKILDNNARVSELIDQDTKRWKEDLIAEIFLEDEAKVIKSIPLSPFPSEDRLIWRGTKNGIFSVRNAYFLEMEKLANQHRSSSSLERGIDWKECWNLNVPNVTKLFLWKALHNLLLTRANLAKKGVLKDTSCPIYRLEEETVLHIIWRCPSSRDVWGGGQIKLQKCGGMWICFPSVFGAILGKCIAEDIELFAVLARRIWLRRNSIIHGECFTHPAQLLLDAQISLEYFRNANRKAHVEDPLAMTVSDIH
jgi:hypothetical protein